jgi:hypothetical protein
MKQEICHRSRGMVFIVAVLMAFSVGVPQVLAAAEDITGEWELATSFNDMQMMSTLTLAKQADGTLTGKWGSADLKDVKFDAGKLTFSRTMSMMGQDTTMKFTGTIKDGKLTGTQSSDQGDTQVTGAKRKPKSPVLGQYQLKYQVGGQDVTAKLILSQNAKGAVDANWISDMAKSVCSNVKVEGDKLTLARKTDFNGNAFESTFEATVKGDKLTGTMKSQMGDAAVTGERIGMALIGKWEITRTTQQGTRTSQLTIDSDLTGRMEAFGGNEIPIKDLKIDGNQMTFKTEMNFGGQNRVTEYKVTVDGKTLKGQSVSPGRDPSELTGKKVEPTPPAAPAATK